MSKPKVAPLNLISNIERPDIDYEGGISARRPKGSGTVSSAQHATRTSATWLTFLPLVCVRVSRTCARVWRPSFLS